MTIFLHVGVGKTGTTTLQVFLEQHNEELARRGVHVAAAPQSRNHRALAMYALDDDVIDNARKAKLLTTPAAINLFREELQARVAQEAASLPRNAKLIFSSEQLTRLSRPSEFARLRSLLSAYGQSDIKIIAYLRRQDLYFTSSYSQYIKGGQDIDMLPTAKLMNQSVYDYQAFLSGWADAFGEKNIIVRVFERGQLVDGDVLADFFSVIGLTKHDDLPRPPRQNESLDVNTLQYLRNLNPHFPRFINGKVNKRRHLLIQVLEAISTGPKPQLSGVQARKFLTHFKEGNEAVARRYLGREDGKLFLEPVPNGPGVAPELDFETSMKISAKVFSRILKG